jgi:hypothetical protein
LVFVLLSSISGVVVGAPPASRPSLVMEGSAARLVLDLAGGSLGEFRLKDSSVNPLNWGAPAAGEVGVLGFGHFLCLDRWGPPSAAEGSKGMPYHGEAAHVVWQAVQEPRADKGYAEARMRAQLPLAGLSVHRRVRLSSNQAIGRVQEDVTNDRPLGRIYNCVQHPTIGPPFLDVGTVVDCNGRRGFAQGNPLPHPEEPSSYWPAALNREGSAVNLRHLTDNPDPNVVSYAIDEPLGWITAATPANGLLIGYLWKTADYPWVSLWRDVRGGQPAARGLEFGTTGLHQPFPVLTEVGRIWNRPLVAHLDAGETQTRTYSVFLLKIPADFAGVERVSVAGPRLVIKERGGASRELTVEAGEELLP